MGWGGCFSCVKERESVWESCVICPFFVHPPFSVSLSPVPPLALSGVTLVYIKNPKKLSSERHWKRKKRNSSHSPEITGSDCDRRKGTEREREKREREESWSPRRTLSRFFQGSADRIRPLNWTNNYYLWAESGPCGRLLEHAARFAVQVKLLHVCCTLLLLSVCP